MRDRRLGDVVAHRPGAQVEMRCVETSDLVELGRRQLRGAADHLVEIVERDFDDFRGALRVLLRHGNAPQKINSMKLDVTGPDRAVARTGPFPVTTITGGIQRGRPCARSASLQFSPPIGHFLREEGFLALRFPTSASR